ncbi:MAG: peptidylprolyl isomerase [candidate division NC10 bacterium]|nr:peptidylprolyl isomerase [candidate division NC10 bacterium]
MRGVWRGAGLTLAAALLTGTLPAGTASGASQPAGPPAGGMVLDRVVAVVNDEAVTLSEIQEEGQPVVRRIFQDFVGEERDRRLEEARALLRAEGLTLEQVRRNVEERLAIGRLLARQIRSAIILNEDELVQSYQSNPDKYKREPSAEIRHILIPIPPGGDEAAARARAEEARAKIQAGADFAEVARQYADGAPGTAGGEPMTVHRGELAPEIEAAAFGQPAGGVSPLVRTESGWHIIKVDRVQAEPVAPYAEVREAIRDQLFQEKFEAKRKDWLASLRARAFIQVLVRAEDLGVEAKKP